MVVANQPIRILLVEDDEDDYILTRGLIQEIDGTDRFELRWVADYKSGLEALARCEADICLVDYYVGGKNGLDLVREARRNGCDVPTILLTGRGDREIDIAAMEAGAADYLEKTELSPRLLERTIRYAIAEAKDRQTILERGALLQATLDYTGAGIATFDRDMNLLAHNDSILSMLGMTADSPEQSADQKESRIGQNISTSLDLVRHTREGREIIARSGRVIEVRSNKMPNGGLATICIDITDRKKAEEILLKSKNEAEAASRAKSEFLANMSHELRTPLNAIIGFTEVMMAHNTSVSEESAHSYLGHILDSGKHLLAVINDILDVSKIEAGKFEIDEIELDPAEVVLSSIRLISERAKQSNVTVTTSTQPRTRELYADERALKQILLNLLSNAIKFTPAGGSVSVDLVTSDCGSLDLVVADTGIGIAEADIERVLTPFYQIQSTLSRSHQGTGLGLALVKSLAELHGGSVSIASKEGAGTQVRVRFPKHRANLATHRASA